MTVAPGNKRAYQRCANTHTVIIGGDMKAAVCRGNSLVFACSFFSHCRLFLRTGDHFGCSGCPGCQKDVGGIRWRCKFRYNIMKMDLRDQIEFPCHAGYRSKFHHREGTGRCHSPCSSGMSLQDNNGFYPDMGKNLFKLAVLLLRVQYLPL